MKDLTLEPGAREQMKDLTPKLLMLWACTKKRARRPVFTFKPVLRTD